MNRSLLQTVRRVVLHYVILTLLFGILASAAQAGLNATYVKTLGQANTKGTPLQGTGYRQLAVDADGNLYYAVVTGWPWMALVKVSPEGRVIWQTTFGGYAPMIPVALADGQLYAICVTQDRSQLYRFDTPSGTQDTEWGVSWTPDTPTPNGIKKLSSAAAMLSAGPYLFIADATANEIRRFDRATGNEKPFAAHIDVQAPIGLAAAKNGNVLILTARSVYEVDLDGKPVHMPLIDGLNAAQSIEVDARSGLIYIAQAGVPGALINQIQQYASDGKPTGVKLGRGGDFNGKWTPDAFAFSAGCADFALDAQSGVWVNTGLGQLTHFTAAPEFKNDRVLLSSDASSVAADGQLNVYLGLGQGGVKLSWENQVLWTSGVRQTGDARRYPSSIVNGWPVYLGFAGAKNPIFHFLHAGYAYALSADTGELVGAMNGSGQDGNFATRVMASGDALYMGFGEKRQWMVTQGTVETLADWKNWKTFFTPPAGLKAGLLGVSPDKSRVYLYDGKLATCLDINGKILWQQPFTPFPGIYVHPFAMLGDSVVFLSGADGKLVARDAKTGEQLAVIGDKKVKRRPPINGFTGLAVAAKDGKNYLFVAGNWQVQVFEITLED